MSSLRWGVLAALLSPSVALAGTDVLLIWDSATSTENADLTAALEAAGMTVTRSTTAETGYDGTNPSPSGFDVVIHLNGSTYSTDMPTAGQAALLAYVKAGGGFIGSEWNAWEVSAGRMTGMVDLVLLDHTSGDDQCSITWAPTAATGYETHQIVQDLPAFSVSTCLSRSPANVYGTDPVEVVMKDSSGDAAVAIRELEDGRVVSIAATPNYSSSLLNDKNVQQLWVNAARWASGAPQVLVVYDTLSTPTTDLVSALDATGFEVTTSDTDETGYDGTNPPLDGFDVIVHLNGSTSATDMPAAGQAAIDAFVRDGGGYVGAEWNGREITAGRLTGLTDLSLLDHDTSDDVCGTWSPAPRTGYDTHALSYGLETGFSLASCYSASSANLYGADPAEVIMRDGDGYDAVVVRELALGRAVSFAMAPNDSDGIAALSDTNVQQLYINAVGWSSGLCDDDGDGALDPRCGGADCDDNNATISPSSPELCDGIDNDCDGTADEDATTTLTWYLDDDGDGYGDPASTTLSCLAPADHVATGTDCDDADAAVHPGATETCDGVDEDCNGLVDDDATDQTWYRDGDGDGYGDPLDSTVACAMPTSYVTDATDCDDTDASVFPGATETCDDDDEDCDGEIDEGATDGDTWYRDEDGDGYGTTAVTAVACDAPTGFVGDASDCNDKNDDVWPGAPEVEYDGIDQDCDGWSDYDQDRDGQDGDDYGGLDCDDYDPTVYDGAPELPDGIDNDCDGAAEDDDRDGDGLSDMDEAAIGTDPDEPDSDGDGLSDGDEVADASNPQDTDGDGTIDALDDDDDGDGIATADEIGDYDWNVPSDEPLDTNDDGTPNHLDDDSDGDGKLDADEGLTDDDCDEIVAFLDALDFDGPCGTGNEVKGGCGCSAVGAGSTAPLWVLGALLGLRRRRR